MRHLLAILISVFVLSFGTNAFAYRSMGCDSDTPTTDESSRFSDSNWKTGDSGPESITPPNNALDDPQNGDESSQFDQDNATRSNRRSRDFRRSHRSDRNCSPGDTTDDGTNPWTPPGDTTDDGTNPWTPPGDTTDDGTNPWTPPGDSTDDGSNPWTWPGDSTDDGTNPWTPPDDSVDDDSNPSDSSDDSANDNSGSDDPSDDTTTFASGTLTVSGSGFGGSAGMITGILCLPVDTEIDSSKISALAYLVEGATAGMVNANGVVLNMLDGSRQLPLFDMTLTSEAILSGGEHLVVAIIDNAPAVTDFIEFSDIGDNDVVAITTVTIDGDTSFNLDYSTLNWIPLSDL